MGGISAARFSHPGMGLGTGPCIQTKRSAALALRTGSKLRATAPWPLGGRAGMSARAKGGPRTLTHTRRRPGRCPRRELVLPPRSPLPRAGALRSGSSASGVCREGQEGGRAAQSRTADADPRARQPPPGKVRRGGSRARVSSAPCSGAPLIPNAAAAAGVNSAPGKSIRDAQGLPIGLNCRRALGGGFQWRRGQRAGAPPVHHRPRPPSPTPTVAPPVGGGGILCATLKIWLLPRKILLAGRPWDATTNIQLERTMGAVRAEKTPPSSLGPNREEEEESAS